MFAKSCIVVFGAFGVNCVHGVFQVILCEILSMEYFRSFCVNFLSEPLIVIFNEFHITHTTYFCV